MPLVDAKNLLGHADRNGYAICAFDVPEVESAQAILHAAEAEKAPVILSVSTSQDLELLLPGIEAAARRAAVPAVLHCEGARSVVEAVRAINLGCNSVASDDRDTAIAKVTESCGVACTDLANGPIQRHRGLAETAAEQLRAGSSAATYSDLMHQAQAAVREEAERALRQSAAGGRADGALAASARWNNIEHCILYNVQRYKDENRAVTAMMADGRRILSRIPGVREVVTGMSVTPDSRYRYCWIVRFAHPAVIDSYRNHPDHVAFADGTFRPIADDRISIVFQSEGDQHSVVERES